MEGTLCNCVHVIIAFDEDIKVILILFSAVNAFELPLTFQHGNRYEVTVCGIQRAGMGTMLVCKDSVQFRTGEGMLSVLSIFFYFPCLSIENYLLII